MSDADILVGKTAVIPTSINVKTPFTHKDHSLTCKSGESGVVDNVVLSTNHDGYKFCKVRVRSVRIPEVGDKFSSRHGQKGVMGRSKTQEDMPWAYASGIVPDIIVNPHAWPSRMTIGQTLETYLGKACCLDGVMGDATPFEESTVDIPTILRKHGFEIEGNELMMNPETGEPMGHAFIGVCYYQRLKHMVADKVHSRARGPVQVLTRQPVEGRARDGGLRIGEMERDGLLAHGASDVINQTLFKQSDPASIFVCESCGFTATENSTQKTFSCRKCKRAVSINQVDLPYAAKLLFQELTCNFV